MIVSTIISKASGGTMTKRLASALSIITLTAAGVLLPSPALAETADADAAGHATARGSSWELDTDRRGTSWE
jgi:hypothetical protein